MTLQIVILAAGSGTRMRSALPKVMHTLAGKPLLEYVYETAKKLLPNEEKPIIVYGFQGELLKKNFAHWDAIWVHQTAQLGTGHAVLTALPYLLKTSRTLILYGDVPLLDPHELKLFLDSTPENTVGILSANVENPSGYGRIIRNEKNQVVDIIEEKDASTPEKAICEINTGILILPKNGAHELLPLLQNTNAQNEFYLTDIVKNAREKYTVNAFLVNEPRCFFGINTRQELAGMERFYQEKQAFFWMNEGVHIVDPKRFDVRGNIKIGQDSFVDINVLLEGNVTIGKHCRIESNVILRDAKLGDHVHLRAHSIVEGAKIGDHAVIGPFARIRPESHIESHAHVGNFVEIKKSEIGAHTKISHLSYIGDAKVGARVNVGAGTITCNYDGISKNKTIIEDDAFIGSDTQLVAPVRIGQNASVGAGSTITKDVKSNTITLTHTLNQRVYREKK